jgi:hypothetical protein
MATIEKTSTKKKKKDDGAARFTYIVSFKKKMDPLVIELEDEIKKNNWRTDLSMKIETVIFLFRELHTALEEIEQKIPEGGLYYEGILGKLEDYTKIKTEFEKVPGRLKFHNLALRFFVQLEIYLILVKSYMRMF